MKKLYWIGDLCYVMHGEWSEVCTLTIKDNECLEGGFNLPDGRRFVLKHTQNGDGCFRDQNGKEYPVDAGLIGVIALEDITSDEKNDISLGNIYEFNVFPNILRTKDGDILVGACHAGGDFIRIPTGGSDEDEDEDYQPEDDEEEF